MTTPDKTNKCKVCGFQDDSRIDMIQHIESHSTSERLNTLIDRVVAEEEADYGGT